MANPFAIFALPSENVIGALTPTVIAGTMDSTYGVGNLVNNNPAIPAKAITTSLTLQWDLTTPTQLGLMTLHNTNLDGVASWRTNAASDFSGAGDTVTITLPAADADGYHDDPWSDLSLITPRRYLRLATTGNSANVAIGEAWAGPGPMRRFTHGHLPNSTRQETHITSNVVTDYGVRLVYDFGARTAGIGSLTVRTSRATGLPAFRTWARSARGKARAFPLVIDPQLNQSMFARFTVDGVSPKIITRDTCDITLTLEEVARGPVPIPAS